MVKITIITVLACYLVGLLIFFREIVYAEPEKPVRYEFRLVRRVRNPSTGQVISTQLRVNRECLDPFTERLALKKEFPRFYVFDDFESEIDKEYEGRR